MPVMTSDRPAALAPGAMPRRDIRAAILMAAAAGAAVWTMSSVLMPAIAHQSTFDFWFESDGPAVMNQLRDRFTFDNERTNRHPLFTLALYPLVAAFRILTDAPTAVSLAYATVAAVLAVLMFLLLRGFGLRRSDAVLFTTLALVSAAAMFWLPVPETFAPAALTLLVPLAALAWHERTGRLSWLACALVSAVTLSMTVTHAVAGALVCLLVLGPRRGFTAVAASGVLVVAGQGVERVLFPHTAPFFLPGGEIETSAYVFNHLAGGLMNRLAGFFLHGMVLPPLQQGYTGYLSVQRAGLGEVPWLVMASWGLWIGLLAVGVAGLVARRTKPGATTAPGARWALPIVQLGVLASQLGLALVFGQETFLYALHSGPLLVILAAFGCLTPWRRWVVTGAAVLVAVAAIENGRRFVEAAARLDDRYESAQAYVRALSAATLPTDLVIVGLPPSEVYGWREGPVRMRPVRLTMLPEFDAVPLARQGWHLHYEVWSPETLERLRQAGARYFVSRYGYGLQHHTSLQNYLDVHARALTRTPDWLIYALEPAGAPPETAR
jgi:hypothetical protein